MKTKLCLFLVMASLAMSQLVYGQEAVPEPSSPLPAVGETTNAPPLSVSSPAPAQSPTPAKQEDAVNVERHEPVRPVLKNPLVVRDGELTELPGEWLFAKDGTPVFVLAVITPESKQAPVDRKPDAPPESFILLVPQAGMPVLWNGGGYGNAAHTAYYPSQRQYYGNGYGGSGGYFSLSSYGGARYWESPRTGAKYLLPSRPDMGPMYWRSPATGAAYLLPSH